MQNIAHLNVNNFDDLLKGENPRPRASLRAMLTYFTFVYRLYHLERHGKKEAFVCCTSECLGRRDVIQRLCFFDSVNPGLPGASSCFEATESCDICTLSWVVGWQSCKVSKPFDPLLLDMMMDALCSCHFSDLGVGNHVSSGLVDCYANDLNEISRSAHILSSKARLRLFTVSVFVTLVSVSLV